MDYEKKYEKLVDAVKVLRDNNPSDEGIQNWVNDNVPELRESEDERIKKSISNYINVTLSDDYSVEKEKWLGWLEKQGEKKSSDEVLKIRQEVYQSGYNDGYKHGCADTIGEKKSINCADNDDKVNSKFKAGDWIIDIQDGEILHINKVRDYAYYVTNLDGASFDTPRCSIETWNRLWTIKDAKDGDVLCDGIDTVIYKKNIYDMVRRSMFVHCGINIRNEYWYEVGGISPIDYSPATKEQRDLLFQKMKEAGYEWDAENKKLKKEEEVDNPHNYLYGEQNLAWSEEDENRFNNLKWLVEHSNEGNGTKEGFIKFIDRLKKRWKPSEEQLDALHDAALYVDKSMFPHPKGILIKMYKQLKKL